MKCRKCDERIPGGSKFCPDCGARQKKEKGQRRVRDQENREKDLLKHIDYLQGELDEADIEYDAWDDEE